MKCIESGCDRTAKARGYCYRHYWRAVRRGEIAVKPPPPPRLDPANPPNWEEWLSERTTWEPNTGCRLWMGAVNWDGYAVTATRPGYTRIVTRLLLAAVGAEMGPGVLACHRCDQPGCVNVDHLFVGTHTDNVRDAARKGRTDTRRAMSAAQVVDAKSRVAAGETLRAVAARHGVSRQTIWNVARGHTWKSVRAKTLIREHLERVDLEAP